MDLVALLDHALLHELTHAIKDSVRIVDVGKDSYGEPNMPNGRDFQKNV